MSAPKKRLHFVYAVPYASKYLKLKVGKTPVYRKYWRQFLKWPNPISAPFSITYNILKALENEYEVLLYDVQEKGCVELGANDLFLGHPWPDALTKKEGKNYWTKFDADEIVNRTVMAYPMDKRVFLISPFNHSEEQTGWLVPLVEQVHCYICICGDYWIDNIQNSILSFLSDRLHNINMGINVSNYPHIKAQFNPQGKRRFLYIGRISEEKNVSMLEAIASHYPNFEGGYIGDGTIKGWKQIASAAALTPQYMQSIAAEYDFFINTSTFDAQATTILEAMSWGFVVACTPQTGYTESSIFPLSTHDTDYNVKALQHLQQLNDDEISTIVSRNKMLLQNKFTWKNFGHQLQQIIAEHSAIIA